MSNSPVMKGILMEKLTNNDTYYALRDFLPVDILKYRKKILKNC